MCFVFFVCGDDDIEVGGPPDFYMRCIEKIFNILYWMVVYGASNKF